MNSNLLSYSLKVWITGAIVGPLFFLIVLQIGVPLNVSTEDLEYSFGIYIAIVGYMFLFSLPTLILLYTSSNLIYRRFNNKLIGKLNRKTIILIITELTILLNFIFGKMIFSGYDGWSKIALCYGFVIGLGIYIYRLDDTTILNTIR